MFYIWSFEHQAFWRANSNGYTTDITEAGLYTEERAKEICDNANKHLPKGAPVEEMIISEQEIAEINNMSHFSMANLWRHAPVGHRYFQDNQPFYNIFKARFAALGGWNPQLSKAVGWEQRDLQD